MGQMRPRELPLSPARSEEHTSELQSRPHLVCRLLLEKKKTNLVNEAALRAARQTRKTVTMSDFESSNDKVLMVVGLKSFIFFFFFNDTATTEIYTLSLHDALPIFGALSALKAPLRKRTVNSGRP